MTGRLVVPSDQFAGRAADAIAERLRPAPGSPGNRTLVLTGGRTVRPVYERLAGSSASVLPWSAVSFYFGDERAVPPDHPESNFSLANRTLFSRIPVAPDRIHRMEAERPDLDDAAREYERILPETPGLLLLTVGLDGHIASIFPGTPVVEEDVRRVVPTWGGDPALARLTITPRVIRESAAVLVLAAGPSRREVVARALEGPADVRSCPAQLVRGATWIMDREAAAGLRSAG